jgi:hypothetical protein
LTLIAHFAKEWVGGSRLELWETTDPCMWAVSRIFTPFAVSQIF